MFLNVLFVLDCPSDLDTAYTHRILRLKEGVEKFGVQTKVLYLGDLLFSKPKLMMPLNIPLISKLLKGYDLIHAGDTAASYVVGVVKSFTDSKIVYDVHGNSVAESRLHRTNIFDPLGNFLVFEAKIMERIAVRRSDFFITDSEPLRRYYIENGIDKDRIEVIYNGVDTGLFKPKNISSGNENFTVTYAGAFQKWQGIDNLILAAKLLKINNIKFKIIGFTKKDLNLKRKIKKILNNKVELIDRVPRTELVNHLNGSDICIIPRNSNPATEMAFPTKFAEYIAVGKLVIVTRVGEISIFVKKYDCGFVCEPTAQSIAKTIIKARRTSPERLFEMGMNGRRLAETAFDQRVISKRYFDFLSEIME